jgi:luciferase family oxidoreductase group 1
VKFPISVLDRSPVRRGRGSAQAVRDTVAFAKEIEALGYHRFWVSEHHSVPGVAGSAPTVLAAAVASATERIRVGTGGVMLPNHRPLVVAEQFGVLAALFPGRVDVGLGRSVGFTDGVRRALGHHREAAGEFGTQVRELLGYFRGDQTTYPGVHAIPAEGLDLPTFLLATGSGADLAAELGLPLVIAPVRGERAMAEAIRRYRDRFTGAEPYVPEAWATVYSRGHGVFPPLSPVDEVLALPMTTRERRRLDDIVASQVSGTPAEVTDRLGALLADADELLVTTSTYDQSARLDSFAALADISLAPIANVSS